MHLLFSRTYLLRNIKLRTLKLHLTVFKHWLANSLTKSNRLRCSQAFRDARLPFLNHTYNIFQQFHFLAVSRKYLAINNTRSWTG